MGTITSDTEIERLEAEHPGWRVWRSVLDGGAPGDWYASRRVILTREQRRAGLWATVHADSADELGGLLAEQEARAAFAREV